jgi:putative transcriptional regulator
MPDSLRGHYLIAGPRLRDPNFFKTAVLIIEHGDEEGAMGLVVNRPSSVSVANALAGHFDLPQTDDVVFVGGPVEPNALFILHNSAELSNGEHPIVPGIYVGTNSDVFAEVIERGLCAEGDPPFRVFCGCAGWGPGQLEGELRRGDWFTLPADLDLMFGSDPYGVWEELLERVHATHRLLPHTSVNPEWN